MPDTSVAPLFCANHPDRETVLRCNRCDKPICYQCAVRTPVGYRCRECVTQQQAVYFNDRPTDPLVAAIVALGLSAVFGALAYAFLRIFGWFSLLAAIFIGPAVGGIIAEAVRRSVGKRRGRNLKYIAAVACVAGFLLGGVLLLGGPTLVGGSVLSLVRLVPALLLRFDVLIVAGLAASTIAARLW